MALAKSLVCAEEIIDEQNAASEAGPSGEYSYRREEKMHNRRASRQKLVDERVDEVEANTSGRDPMGEDSDLEVLDVVTEALLSMILPTEDIPVTRCQRTIVTKDSDEEEIIWGKGCYVGPSGGGEGEKLQGGDSEDSAESDEAEGAASAKDWIMLDRFAGKLELSMELPLRRLAKEVLNFLGVAPVQMNGNFYEMMRVIEGMNMKLAGEGRGPKCSSGNNSVNYIDTLLKTSEDWVSAQVEKGKGRVAPDAPKVQQSKVIQRKRRKILGEDDTMEKDEEMMEAE
ncbi:hypothetical protein GIB67_010623 [Kingdonia uniflora]|uniref:Uncharacterized protein n=1 Tax=Kingdonia uniflora TaxID=39325 RepID=A0A7J7M832_9MAGN|nr:hypothetical protein GIB67_010623 [Kingdonia uniflora]